MSKVIYNGKLSDVSSLGDAETTRLVLERFQDSKINYVDKMRPYWKACLEQFFADKEETEESDTYHNAKLPFVFYHVEQALTRVIGGDPRIEVWADSSGDPENVVRAQLHRALCFYYHRKLNLSFHWIPFMKMALTLGLGWMKVYWHQEQRLRQFRVKTSEPIFDADAFQALNVGALPTTKLTRDVYTVEDRLAVTYDDPRIDWHHIDEVYPDPKAGEDLERTAKYICEPVDFTLGDLLAFRDGDSEGVWNGALIGKLKEQVSSGGLSVGPASDHESLQEDFRGPMGEILGTSNHTTSDTREPVIRAIQYWTPDERILVLRDQAEDAPPLINTSNRLGMYPYAKCTPIPLLNSIHGLGYAPLLATSSDLIDRNVNLGLDATYRGAQNLITVTNNSGLLPEEVQFGEVPNYVNSHDDIQMRPVPGNSFAMHRQVDSVRQLAQLIVGSGDIGLGVDTGSGGDTATEASLLFQAVQGRTGMMSKVFSTQTLNRLGRLLIRHTQAFASKEKILQVSGNNLDILALGPLSKKLVLREDRNAQGTVTSRLVRVPIEMLIAAQDEEMFVTWDVGANEPINRQFKFNRAMAALQVIANPEIARMAGLGPEAVLPFIIDLYEGAGHDSIALQLGQQGPLGGGQPQAPQQQEPGSPPPARPPSSAGGPQPPAENLAAASPR